MNDDVTIKSDWPFDVPSNTGCVTTRQIMEKGYPILAILHDDDGAWQVLCDTTEDPNDGMIVGLGCLYERFPILGEFSHMPPGYEAVRKSECTEWGNSKDRI